MYIAYFNIVTPCVLAFQILHMKGPGLPDFESEEVSTDEQQHYLNALLSSQLQLARAVCSDSPFASVLQKRFIVLQRIFYAICSKYHDPDKSRQHQVRCLSYMTT